MLIIIGSIIVFASVVGGYLLEHGNLSVLFQPVELLIIGGAALGGLIIMSPMRVIKDIISSVLRALAGKSFSKSDYMDSLLMLSEIFTKIRKEGLVSIEADVDSPRESRIFGGHPIFLKNHHAVALVTDTLRTVMTTSISSYELENMLDNELEAHHEESMAPAKVLNTVSEALPGLGIVAAVLGVILTMAKMKEPPEILGASIGAALVGTFLGVLLCYGFVGPLSKNLEVMAADDKEYLVVLKMGIIAFIGGAAPQIAVEFARRAIPGHAKPSFAEVEDALRANKK